MNNIAWKKLPEVHSPPGAMTSLRDYLDNSITPHMESDLLGSSSYHLPGRKDN